MTVVEVCLVLHGVSLELVGVEWRACHPRVADPCRVGLLHFGQVRCFCLAHRADVD